MDSVHIPVEYLPATVPVYLVSVAAQAWPSAPPLALPRVLETLLQAQVLERPQERQQQGLALGQRSEPE
jgi:hypothetical protein